VGIRGSVNADGGPARSPRAMQPRIRPQSQDREIICAGSAFTGTVMAAVPAQTILVATQRSVGPERPQLNPR